MVHIAHLIGQQGSEAPGTGSNHSFYVCFSTLLVRLRIRRTIIIFGQLQQKISQAVGSNSNLCGAI